MRLERFILTGRPFSAAFGRRRQLDRLDTPARA
jgi:hypothetical protein